MDSPVPEHPLRSPFKLRTAGNYWVALRYANGRGGGGEQSSNPTVYPPGKGSLSVYVNGTKYTKTYLESYHELECLDDARRSFSRSLPAVIKSWYRFDAGDVGRSPSITSAFHEAMRRSTDSWALISATNKLTNQKFTRLDPNIDFDGDRCADPTMNADSFSVRWTGFIATALLGTYTFYSNPTMAAGFGSTIN